MRKKSPVNLLELAISVIGVLLFVCSGQSLISQENPGELLWKYNEDTGGNPIRSTAAVSNGRVFVMDSRAHFVALNASNGEELWSKKLNRSRVRTLTSSPLTMDDRVYVGTSAGKMLCFSAEDGEKIWSYQANAGIFSSPATDGNRIFFGSRDSNVYCLTAKKGREVWKKDVGGRIVSTPAYYKNRVIVGAYGGNVVALGAENGKEKWSFDVGEDVLSSPAVARNKVVITGEDEVSYFLDADTGEKFGEFETEQNDQYRLASSPSIKGNVAFIGKEDFYLYAVSLESAKQQWKKHLGGDVDSSPAILGDTVYAGDWDNGNVVALERTSGEEKWSYKLDDELITSPVVSNGRLFISDNSGTVYCIKTNSPRGKKWPMFRGNSARTGTRPEPRPIGERGKKFWKHVENEALSDAQKILKEWPEEERIEQRHKFYERTVEAVRLLNKKNYRKVIDIWSDLARSAHRLIEDRKRLYRILKTREKLLNWLKQKSKDLGASKFQTRKETMELLKKAGPLAFSIVRSLESSDDPEVRMRAAMLYRHIKTFWRGFVEK